MGKEGLSTLRKPVFSLPGKEMGSDGEAVRKPPLPTVLNLFSETGPELKSLRLFLAPLFGLLAAELPDDAALAEFAIEAGVGAGPARVQALLAVGNLHFLADDAGVPVRVMAAFIHKFHCAIITKPVVLNQAAREFPDWSRRRNLGKAGGLAYHPSRAC
jgi:hypothetical protein